MAARPKSQKEIIAEKKNAEQQNKKRMIIYNVSKQMVPIRLQAPIDPDTGKRADFYRAENCININPGKSAIVVESRLDKNQVLNLRKRGFIKIKSIIA